MFPDDTHFDVGRENISLPTQIFFVCVTVWTVTPVKRTHTPMVPSQEGTLDFYHDMQKTLQNINIVIVPRCWSGENLPPSFSWQKYEVGTFSATKTADKN
jgi:hypothetical protein